MIMMMMIGFTSREFALGEIVERCSVAHILTIPKPSSPIARDWFTDVDECMMI